MPRSAPRGPGWLPRVACSAAVTLGLAIGHKTLAADASPQLGEADDAGVHVQWTVRPVENARDTGLAILEVSVTEGLGNTPLRLAGQQVYAWLQRRRGDLLEAEQPCRDRVKSLMSQGLGQHADIDLNDYRLVTLNTDRTVAMINPFVGLSNAKLESIVELPGTPQRWLQIPERAEIWVALTDPARLVAFDLQARRITRTVSLPSEAGALAFDHATRRLWITLGDTLGSLDLAAPNAALDQIPAEGAATLFITPPSSDASGLSGLVSLHAGGLVTLYQSSDALRWRLRDTGIAAQYSRLAHRLLVATAGGELAWIDPGSREGAVERHLTLGHAVRALGVFDDGRRAMALGNGHASVIDVAQGSILAQLDAPALADAVLITDRFAFAVSVAEGRATLWSLSDLRAGKVAPISVQLGRAAPDTRIPSAATTVAAPDGDGLLVANPTDGVIYRYNEGMMAPSGTFSNYRRAAIGLEVFDPSVREIEPGRYRGTIRSAEGGSYLLVLAGSGPRFAACGTVRLAPTARSQALQGPKPKPAFVGTTLPDGGDPLRPTIEIKLETRTTGQAAPLAGVEDLTLLVFDRHSGWQMRMPLKERAGGLYVAELRLPRPGRYDLLASSASSDMAFGDGYLGAVSLGAAQP